jgi:hypothetical protein
VKLLFIRHAYSRLVVEFQYRRRTARKVERAIRLYGARLALPTIVATLVEAQSEHRQQVAAFCPGSRAGKTVAAVAAA